MANKYSKTPWYLRMIGFKYWRRKENVPVVFGIFGYQEKWVYYRKLYNGEGVK